MSEWIEWDGGKCPVDGWVRVDYRMKGSDTVYSCIAGNLRWSDDNGPANIVSYKVSGGPLGALDTQIGGDHYKQFRVQPVEFINANNMDFLQGSVIKYISRHKLKGKQADVEKAIHFCKLILELQYESASS